MVKTRLEKVLRDKQSHFWQLDDLEFFFLCLIAISVAFSELDFCLLGKLVETLEKIKQEDAQSRTWTWVMWVEERKCRPTRGKERSIGGFHIARFAPDLVQTLQDPLKERKSSTDG